MLIRSFFSLFLVLSISCAAPQESNNFENEIKAFELADKSNPSSPGGDLLAGSSSMD